MLQIVVFLTYSSLIFFIKDYAILGCIFLINLLLALIFKVKYRKILSFIIKLLPFILFVRNIKHSFRRYKSWNINYIKAYLGFLCNIYIFREYDT